MQSFTVYKTATGEIDRTGQAPLNMVSMQANAGESTLVGHLDPKLYWISTTGPRDRPVAPVIGKNWVTGIAGAMSNVGAGAVVTVTDAYGTEHVFSYDAADPLILVDSGTYTINVSQPFPAHSITQIIEVTNA